jgi:ribonuclease HII
MDDDLYQYDESLREKGFLRIAGLDEAGRGPLAGPVVAAAVVFSNSIRIKGLRDSKKVPEKERECLYKEIVRFSVDIGVGIVGHEEIDRLNILRSTRLAMQCAVKNLSKPPDLLVIDAVSLPSIRIKQFSIIKGESVSASIAAASIVAKCERDKIMLEYHHQFPHYNFDKNKGYSTKDHLDMLKIYGPCPIHRKSFQRVMSLDLPF